MLLVSDNAGCLSCCTAFLPIHRAAPPAPKPISPADSAIANRFSIEPIDEARHRMSTIRNYCLCSRHNAYIWTYGYLCTFGLLLVMFQKGRAMTDTEYRVGPIDVRWGKDHYKFYVVGDSLYTEWVSGFDRSKVSCPLRGLSPDFTETTGRSSGIAQTVRMSMLLVASSIIVFFSDYQAS